MTRHRVNSFRTDFVWPDLGLVVEADSLRAAVTIRPVVAGTIVTAVP